MTEPPIRNRGAGQAGVRTRHDWRFLVPADRAGCDVLLLGDDGTGVDAARRCGLFGDVTAVDDVTSLTAPASPGNGPAGVVVALRGAGVDVDALLAGVGPDAVVVVESDPGPWARASTEALWARAARRHARAVATWLVAPDPSSSGWCAPLTPGLALRWYVDTRFIPATLALAGAAAALTRATRWPVVSGALAPALLGVFAPDARPPTPTEILGLHGIPGRVQVPGRDGTAADVVVLSSGQDRTSRTVLVTVDACGTPVEVVKLATDPDGNDRAVAAGQRLAALWNELDGAGAGGDPIRARAAARVRATIPAPTGDDRLGTLARHRQTPCPDPSALRVLGARTTGAAAAARVLDDVLAWAGDLGRSAAPETVTFTDDVLDAWIRTPLAAVSPDAAAAVDALFRPALSRPAGSRPAGSPPATLSPEGLVGTAGVERGPSGPLVPAHLDLVPANVTWDAAERRVTALDWEPAHVGHGPDGSLRRRAPLGVDACFFATYWALQRARCPADTPAEIAVVRELLGALATAGPATDPADHSPATWAGATLRRHLDAVGCSPTWTMLVPVLLWTQRARDRAVRVVRAGPSAPANRELGASIGFLAEAVTAYVAMPAPPATGRPSASA